MHVKVERDGRIFVTEDFGQRFNVHSALYGSRGKGMPQGVKAFMLHPNLF